MAVASDVPRLPPDGVQSARLHPHLVALVRWCVSCLWGAAAVVLRRLLELPPAVPPLPPLPPVAALVRSTLHLNAARKRGSKPRVSAHAPHISNAATVDCEVLRAPVGDFNVDVIFVHGLYGSLANTWRQGQWRTKHKTELNKIPLRRPSLPSETPCTCNKKHPRQSKHKTPANDEACMCKDENDDQINKIRKHNISKHHNDVKNGFLEDLKLKKTGDTELKKNNAECTDSELNNTEIERNLDEYNEDKYNESYTLSNINIVDSYTDFMKDIFTNDARDNYSIDFDSGCDIDMIFSSISDDGAKTDSICDKTEPKDDLSDSGEVEDIIEECNKKYLKGHICKACSDEFEHEIKEKYICEKCANKLDIGQDDKESIEECILEINEKCVRKHEYVDTDESNIEGLAHETSENSNYNSDNRENLQKENNIEESAQETTKTCEIGCGCVCARCYSDCWPRDWLQIDYPDARVISINYTSDPYLWRPIWIKESKRLRLHERAEQMTEQLLALDVGSRPIVWVGHSKGGLFIKQMYSEGFEEYVSSGESKMAAGKARLWASTAGFMFYSVPHRGSPLADFNIPPLVARSIELLEMGKDCSEVLSLQERWLSAVEGARAHAGACAGGTRGLATPVVRSLVETRRTLMAVLWLRIVSVESADAGIGALCGVSVDHREICKPSGRSCLLYRELLRVIDAALGRTRARRSDACSCH